MYRKEHLLHISKQFQIYGEILHAESCKIGHINETYTATYAQGGLEIRYIHQKINQSVFRRPGEVMENMIRVTGHIRNRLEAEEAHDITRRVLTIVPTREGRPAFIDDEGNYWRTFVFVENTETFEAVEKPKQAFQAGRAFGNFQKYLADLNSPRLHETIPDFHHARKRYEAFQAGVNGDLHNRARNARKEIKFCERRERIVDVVLKALEKGKIPERITHNDTKFNNVMLDVNTGDAMCVVDLDTVMPGVSLYDFGDMVRTTTSPTLEDELDLSKVRMHMPMFKELARGYLEQAAEFLTKEERSLIAFSGKLMTFTIGLRFLTDYLQGDGYFRVHRPHHNLDRARTQFRLVESIERQEEAMQRFVDSLA